MSRYGFSDHDPLGREANKDRHRIRRERRRRPSSDDIEDAELVGGGVDLADPVTFDFKQDDRLNILLSQFDPKDRELISAEIKNFFTTPEVKVELLQSVDDLQGKLDDFLKSASRDLAGIDKVDIEFSNYLSDFFQLLEEIDKLAPDQIDEANPLIIELYYTYASLIEVVNSVKDLVDKSGEDPVATIAHEDDQIPITDDLVKESDHGTFRGRRAGKGRIPKGRRPAVSPRVFSPEEFIPTPEVGGNDLVDFENIKTLGEQAKEIAIQIGLLINNPALRSEDVTVVRSQYEESLARLKLISTQLEDIDQEINYGRTTVESEDSQRRLQTYQLKLSEIVSNLKHLLVRAEQLQTEIAEPDTGVIPIAEADASTMIPVQIPTELHEVISTPVIARDYAIDVPGLVTPEQPSTPGFIPPHPLVPADLPVGEHKDLENLFKPGPASDVLPVDDGVNVFAPGPVAGGLGATDVPGPERSSYQQAFETWNQLRKKHTDTSAAYRSAVDAFYRERAESSWIRRNIDKVKDSFGVHPKFPPEILTKRAELFELTQQYSQAAKQVRDTRAAREGNRDDAPDPKVMDRYLRSLARKQAMRTFEHQLGAQKQVWEKYAEEVASKRGYFGRETAKVVEWARNPKRARAIRMTGGVVVGGTVGLLTGGTATAGVMAIRPLVAATASGLAVDNKWVRREIIDAGRAEKQRVADGAFEQKTKDVAMRLRESAITATELEQIFAELEQLYASVDDAKRSEVIKLMGVAILVGFAAGFSTTAAAAEFVPGIGEVEEMSDGIEIKDIETLLEPTGGPVMAGSQAGGAGEAVPPADAVVTGSAPENADDQVDMVAELPLETLSFESPVRIDFEGVSVHYPGTLTVRGIEFQGPGISELSSSKEYFEHWLAIKIQDVVDNPNISAENLAKILQEKLEAKYQGEEWWSTHPITGVTIDSITYEPVALPLTGNPYIYNPNATERVIVQPVEVTEIVSSSGTENDFDDPTIAYQYHDEFLEEPTADPESDESLGLYTMEEGKNLWRIFQGRTAAGALPIMEHISEANTNRFISAVERHLNTHPDLLRELNFGRTASDVRAGVTIDLDRLQAIAEQVAHEQDFVAGAELPDMPSRGEVAINLLDPKDPEAVMIRETFAPAEAPMASVRPAVEVVAPAQAPVAVPRPPEVVPAGEAPIPRGVTSAEVVRAETTGNYLLTPNNREAVVALYKSWPNFEKVVSDTVRYSEIEFLKGEGILRDALDDKIYGTPDAAIGSPFPVLKQLTIREFIALDDLSEPEILKRLQTGQPIPYEGYQFWKETVAQLRTELSHKPTTTIGDLFARHVLEARKLSIINETNSSRLL